jgi:hypothetical protein
MSEIHWLQAVNGSFTNAADWSGGVVPGASDDAILDAQGAPYTVTASSIEMLDSIQTSANATLLVSGGYFGDRKGTGSGQNAGVILLGADATFVAGGQIDNSGRVSLYGAHATFTASGQVSNSGTISLYGARATFSAAGQVDNTGTILVSGGATGAVFLIKKSATLTGGGQIELGDGPDVFRCGAGASYNVDNTISGSGTIVGAITNGARGLIDATSAVGLTVTGSTMVNGGVLESTGGGALTISTDMYQRDGGLILATSGSTVTVGGEVVGGTIEAARYGTVVLSGLFVEDVTTEGTITGGADVRGTLTNLGEIYGGLGVTRSYLAGGGELNLGSNGEIRDFSSYGYFTNVDNLIIGGGVIGYGPKCEFTNDAAGVVDDDGAKMQIGEVRGGGSAITNAGLIECNSTGGLIFGATLLNTGTIVANLGTITVDKSVTGSGVFVLDDATLVAESDFNEFVVFTGKTGVLKLTYSQFYGGAIVGFSKTGRTSLDLLDITFDRSTQATYSGGRAGGVLTVTDQESTARIDLQGNYLGCTFSVASDGDHGVLVVANQNRAATAPLHAFIASMAALTGSVAQTDHLVEAWSDRAPILVSPRVEAF